MGGQLFNIDGAKFKSQFPDKPFIVNHDLAKHPMLQLPALIEFSKRHPADRVEYYSGQIPVSGDPRKSPRTGLTIDETLTQIESAKSWLVLKNIETDPEYVKLVHACLEEISAFSEPIDPGMYRRQGWIFVTSPGSTTPYHIDPEHNFLMQVRGTKTVHVWDGMDRSILSEIELENYYTDKTSKYRNLDYLEDYQKKAMTFTMKPGEGLYIPVADPHWVKVENEVSISLSLSFYASKCDRRARLHRFNASLRKLGLNPRPYGRAPVKESVVNSMYSTLGKFRRAFGGA